MKHKTKLAEAQYCIISQTEKSMSWVKHLWLRATHGTILQFSLLFRKAAWRVQIASVRSDYVVLEEAEGMLKMREDGIDAKESAWNSFN